HSRLRTERRCAPEEKVIRSDKERVRSSFGGRSKPMWMRDSEAESSRVNSTSVGGDRTQSTVSNQSSPVRSGLDRRSSKLVRKNQRFTAGNRDHAGSSCHLWLASDRRNRNAARSVIATTSWSLINKCESAERTTRDWCAVEFDVGLLSVAAELV